MEDNHNQLAYNHFGPKPTGLHTILVLVLLTLVSLSIYVFYQLFLHPLAKYPGPMLAKLSIVRAGYHAWKGDGHLDIWRLHNAYGPIVRYGPNWLLFNSVEGYKDIYGAKQNTEKHGQFSQFNPRAVNLFTINNKNEHSQRRRCIGKAFSEASIEKFEGQLICHVKKFCDQIGPPPKRGRNHWSEPRIMSDWAAYLIFDTMTDFLLGQGYDLLGSTKYRPITHHIRSHIIRPAVCSYIPLLAVLKIDKLLFKDAAKSTKAFWRWVKGAIANRSQQIGHLTDVFAYIQLSREPEQCPTVGIQSETGMFVVAGFDTTTTALCALLFYLSRSQRAYDRLCKEIRSRFDHEELIRLGPRLKSCAFLYACIDEALRMSPPIGSPPWREAGAGGEIIAGAAIPQGCSVGTGPYSVHHNEGYFVNPHEFIPERWLHDSESEGPSDKVFNPAFMPFSMGPRSCIGRSLVYAEMSLIVAILLWRYDFRASPGLDLGLGQEKQVRGQGKVGRANPNEFQLVDRVVGHPEGPVIEFRRRISL